MATVEEVNPVRNSDSESHGPAGGDISSGVKKLAALARIEVPESELEKFTKEFDAILAYVSQLEKLDLPADAGKGLPQLRNVLRADGNAYEPGIFTAKLKEQFPEREGDLLVVKQVITHE
jgi:aspartyl-tRNA(Asn)/glutamyl-tRNA(Gln) amidotransferase subunit C